MPTQHPLSRPQIGEDIAKETAKEWKGLRVTVKLTVQNRQAKVSVIPSAASLVIKALKEPVRDRKKEKNIVHSGNLALEDVYEIARIMRDRSCAAGFAGKFTATAKSEAPEFLSAAGDAGEGATVMATSSPQNTPTAKPFREAFTARYKRDPGFDAQQAYDSVRTIAHAANKAKSLDGAKMVAKMTELDPQFVNSLGVVRFARDHTLLYDNRVILKVKDGTFTWDRSLRTDSLG